MKEKNKKQLKEEQKKDHEIRLKKAGDSFDEYLEKMRNFLIKNYGRRS